MFRMHVLNKKHFGMHNVHACMHTYAPTHAHLRVQEPWTDWAVPAVVFSTPGFRCQGHTCWREIFKQLKEHCTAWHFRKCEEEQSGHSQRNEWGEGSTRESMSKGQVRPRVLLKDWIGMDWWAQYWVLGIPEDTGEEVQHPQARTHQVEPDKWKLSPHAQVIV